MFESEVLWSAYHLSEGNVATPQYDLFAKFTEAIENAKNLNVSSYRFYLFGSNLMKKKYIYPRLFLCIRSISRNIIVVPWSRTTSSTIQPVQGFR